MKKKILTDINEFVIKRSEWSRGRESCLLDSNGQKCCLGFYALACGLSKSKILEETSPENLERKYYNNKWDTFLLENNKDNPWGYDSGSCTRLMEINDDNMSSDKDKEKEIKSIFKGKGIKVKFVD